MISNPLHLGKLPSEIIEVYKTATCLYSRKEIESALDAMAESITNQLGNSNPILIGVVVGGIVTLGNLLPRLNFLLEVDYIHATRYQQSLRGQEFQLKVKPGLNLQDRTIILVDDILDGGITMQCLIDFCHQESVAAVHSAVLVDKREARIFGGLEKADFVGLEIDNHYVFGYGLDYKGYLRNAPGIFQVASKFE